MKLDHAIVYVRDLQGAMRNYTELGFNVSRAAISVESGMRSSLLRTERIWN